ncbi:unnamed protein product [Protopolystoma xenopodis]|uniref:Uncharacterized protein n=1 Tax=Protopolystoma xenopodis TaxID=117903 RepID=A0A448XJB0_9PLAT|nr:unnamed protein product [Protopolystoma xenopodis]
MRRVLEQLGVWDWANMSHVYELRADPCLMRHRGGRVTSPGRSGTVQARAPPAPPDGADLVFGARGRRDSRPHPTDESARRMQPSPVVLGVGVCRPRPADRRCLNDCGSGCGCVTAWYHRVWLCSCRAGCVPTSRRTTVPRTHRHAIADWLTAASTGLISTAIDRLIGSVFCRHLKSRVLDYVRLLRETG